MKKSALQRYRMAVRDGADPDPFRTEMAHKAHSTLVLRSPSTVFCGQFRDAHPDMPQRAVNAGFETPAWTLF